MSEREPDRREQERLLTEAILVLDGVRREHNGIFGVDIFLGHDGHNQVKFRSYKELIATGESGRNLLEAVHRACNEMKRNRFFDSSRATIVAAIGSAIESYGDGDAPNLFNTSGFQQYFLKEYGYTPNGSDVATLLEEFPRVVRLKGGSHWMLLPDGVEKYEGGQ